MKGWAITLALVLTALLAGTALGATIWRGATVGVTEGYALRDLINAEHHRVCGSYLVNDAQLVWVARWKAQDMGYRGYFAHAALDGSHVWDFYDRVGIPWSKGTGEILAWNSYPDDYAASVAYSQFMASSSHRAAIRNCAFDRFGVGSFKAGTKRLFAVEFTNVQ